MGGQKIDLNLYELDDAGLADVLLEVAAALGQRGRECIEPALTKLFNSDDDNVTEFSSYITNAG